MNGTFFGYHNHFNLLIMLGLTFPKFSDNLISVYVFLFILCGHMDLII